MLSLNRTPKLSFEPRFHIFVIYVYYKKANAFSPWSLCSFLQGQFSSLKSKYESVYRKSEENWNKNFLMALKIYTVLLIF